MVDFADAAADAAVAPGFSRAGFALRRRLERWGDPPAMAGRTAVVTGATSGIGLATAVRLAALGASVHIIGRDAARSRAAAAAVEAAGPGAVYVDLADMAEPGEVEALGRRLADQHPRVDALVHAAGALSRDYRANAEGTEITVATQVLGPYVLTAALAPSLWRGPGNIVVVSSGGMYAQPFDLDRLEMKQDGYDGVVAYARAKRAQVVMADAWAARFAAADVAAYSMHPGWVDTPGLQAGLPRFRAVWRPLLRSPAEGADTIVWLAAGGALGGAGRVGADEAGAGGVGAGGVGAGGVGAGGARAGFYHDRRLRPVRRWPLSRPVRPGDEDALLAWCAARTGTQTPRPSGLGGVAPRHDGPAVK
jgi:NAD(P)-dependent dehydrogenase (short-subunit alcohol dehydrogenase family)